MAFSAFAQPNESWLRRTWHNMNARFNGLYHSKVRLQESVNALKEGHQDNFNEIISVFPYGTPEQRQAQKGNLEEVYKKCSNLINKHNKSRWVDDAWYLIGESYLFQNEHYTAIETFQYVANQFPDGERKYDAKLGILMAYIAQEKYYDAEAIMSIIKKEGDFPKRLDRDFAAISAEVYIHQEKYLQAIESLEKALSLTRNKDQRSRYNFILAQLYLETDQIAKSKEKFVRTIKLNPPYELAFQSNLGLIKTISMSEEKSLKTPRKYLKKMLNDDKNIEYFDQIYFELGNLEKQDGNIPAAIENYQKSAATSTKNQDQKTNSYLALATIYFDRKEYELSQKYFDSTALFVSPSRTDYEQIKAKQLVLTDLIENLVDIYAQDSLLRLSKMSKEELDQFINAMYEKDLKDAQLAKEREEQNQPIFDGNDPFNQPNKIQNNTIVGGAWYFYNPSAITRGSNDFKRKWGSRPKTDLWRYASMQASLNKPDEPGDQGDEGDDSGESNDDALTYDKDQDKETQEILGSVEKDKRKYYEPIPFSQGAKDAALAKIEKGLFGAGKIYFEDLKEPEKAKSYLLKLLERFPGSNYEPETYFIMVKLMADLGNRSESEKYSKLLNEKYPKNPFNLVLNDKEAAVEMSGSSQVSKLYQEAYNAYKAGDFKKALEIKEKAARDYAGNSLQANFDYLHALIIGQTEGKAAYIDYLTRIVELYPGTQIANMADYTLALLREKDKAPEEEGEFTSDYVLNPGEEHYFITIYDGVSEGQVMAGFSEYNKKNHGLEKLRLNSYILGEKNIVAVQSFKNKDEAEKYYVEFIKSDKFFKDLGIRAYDIYTISKSNFRTLLSDKDTDAYAVFFVRNYIQ